MTRAPRKLFPPAPVPDHPTLARLQAAATDCRSCDLYENAAQTVFGEGKPHAKVMFVGEQPGDQEDRQGKPFVGPAGRLLDSALEEAGIDRAEVYITNAVKHFKWERRGKRRTHKKPSATEITACSPWLEAEIAAMRPRAIVCLGATAAPSLLGRDFLVTQHRGEFLKSPLAPIVMATVHPSSILRAPDEETRRVERERFVEDLTTLSKAFRKDP